MPIRRIGTAAHLGTAIHKAAETHYRECISEKRWVPVRDDLKGVAIDTLRECNKTEEPADLKERDQNEDEKLVSTGAINYALKSRVLNKDQIPIDVERRYEIPVNSKVVKSIAGTLDIVGENFVADIKTMSRMKSVKEYAIQQGAYAILREKNGENVEDLLIHRVILSKNQIDSQSILECTENAFGIGDLVESTRFYLESVIHTINDFDKTGNELLFRGNPKSMLCSSRYCAYYKDCKWRSRVGG